MRSSSAQTALIWSALGGGSTPAIFSTAWQYAEEFATASSPEIRSLRRRTWSRLMLSASFSTPLCV